MKLCPNCNTQNEDEDAYCNKCGYSFKPPKKSHAFRNFFIGLSVFFSIVIIGLVIYFLIINGVIGNFSGKTEDQPLAEGPIEDEEVIEESAGFVYEPFEFSQDQKRLLAMTGYPDQFIIIFDEGNNNRVEYWMYEDFETSFVFEDGVYTESSDFFPEELGQSDYDISPGDFSYMMSPEDINIIMGIDGKESTEELTGLKVLAFGQGELICIFNDDDGLIGVMRNKKLNTKI